MAAGVRMLVNKPETMRKDCRSVPCQYHTAEVRDWFYGQGTYSIFSRAPHSLNHAHVVECHGCEEHLG
jgi:hypothetical protein